MLGWSVFTIAFALGWDSLAAGLGMGMLAEARARALRIAIVFGVSDGLASLAGMLFGHAVGPMLRSVVQVAGPLLVALTGLVVLAFPDLAQRAFSADRWMMMGVPMAFTLDNLNVGLGRGLVRMPPLLEPALIGVVSGLMAWLGMRFALRAQRVLPEYTARAAGMMLMAVAVHDLVT